MIMTGSRLSVDGEEENLELIFEQSKRDEKNRSPRGKESAKGDQTDREEKEQEGKKEELNRHHERSSDTERRMKWSRIFF